MKQRSHNILAKLIALQALILLVSISTLGQAPIANFSGSPLSGCSPLVVNFQDLSTRNPTSWSWNFGNGNTSALRNPTATYFTSGTYTVTLTATNASGSNTLVRNAYVTVYETPVVNFSSDRTSGCFPLRVQFTDLSTAGSGNTNVAWLWDFGDGNTSTLQNPANTYNSSGNFSVTLRVTNDKGCVRVLSRTNYISVTNGVTANFTHTQPSVCGVPADVTFTNTSTGPPTLSYLWEFGDGNTSSIANPTHTYTTAGTYIVKLTATSTAGCTDTVVSAPILVGAYVTSFTAPAQICIGATAVFTNTSAPVPASSIWSFGDGGQANTLNATHRYATAGVYNVRLYNNYGNCVDSTVQQITVTPKPIIDFTAPVTSRCQPPLTVNFQDMTPPGAVSWQWDFGDGGTSTLQNPSHTYTTFGSFNVRLIVTTASGCIDSLIKPGYVIIRRPTVSFTDLPTRGCVPYPFTFNPTISSVDAVTSYSWAFGDGGTSTASNPTYTYTTQGIYNVRLIITTSSGCTLDTTFLQAVKVGTKPVANFTATPLSVCASDPIQFTDLSAPADEWLWDFGDGGSSIQKNPLYKYRDTGYFDVRLIAYNSGCADTIIRSNYVYILPPVARFDIVPDCSNRLLFNFIDQSIAPQTWSWTFGDGGTSTASNPSHTYPALGSYNVKLVVTYGACIDSITQVVKAIDEAPDFFADNVAACKGTPTSFHASGINFTNIASYTWDFGDGNSATVSVPDINHTYLNSGNYTVILTTTDINGCTDSRTKNNYIRVNGPLAAFSATNPSGCAGMTTTFNDLSTTDGINAIVNWQFDFGDGVIQNFTAPPFQHTYATIDSFTVRMTITDAAGCIDSVRINNFISTTAVLANFTSTFQLSCPGSGIIFQNSSAPAGVSTLWDFGDGNTSTTPSPIHVYTAPGLYTVKLVVQDANACADSLIRTDYIRIDNPIADFDVSDTASSCIPFEVRFTNTSFFYYDSYWDFGPGEGTSTLANPIHFYNSPGTYPIKLVVVSPGGCRDSITKSIRLYDTAGTRMNYLPIGGCSPLNANFSAFSPGPMSSYLWDFGDGYTDTTTTPSANHVYRTFGNYVPKLILQDPGGCIIPIQGADTVFVVGAKAKFGQTDSLFCDFGTVNFLDSTTFNDPIVSYNWTFGDGGISNQPSPVHNYTTPGLYTVQLRIVTAAGCQDTLIKPNLVAVVQSPDISINGDTSICVNSSAQHQGVFNIPDTSIVSWAWSFPNGTSSNMQNPPAQTYNTVGTYTITAIAINSTGCIDTSLYRITITPLPTVTMPSQMTITNGFPQTIPATYSPGTTNWLWSPAAGLSCTTCPTPDAGPKFSTRYRVRFTDNIGCSNSAIIQVYVVCKDANLFIPNTFSPNGDGSNEVFYPRGRGLERIKLLRIFNRWGEVVYEKRDVPVNDPSIGWDGTFRGRKPMADVYVFQAEVFCENGEIIKLNGNIALIL